MSIYKKIWLTKRVNNSIIITEFKDYPIDTDIILLIFYSKEDYMIARLKKILNIKIKYYGKF